ncbi:MAG: type IV pilin protein [Massilia sp.]
MKRLARGFTLIEIMVTVAIVGILMAVAIPSYSAYVQRAKLTEAFTSLASFQPALEQFWANNRTFEGFADLPATTNFTYTLTTGTATAYTIKATGRAAAANFSYTIDQSGARATLTAPTGWTTQSTCWVDRKDGSCTQ